MTTKIFSGIKEFVKYFIREIGFNPNVIRKKYEHFFDKDICRNVNKTKYNKNCLILYLMEPFKRDIVSETHQNLWQIKNMALILKEFKYNVDVVDYNNNSARLYKKYDLIIDIGSEMNSIYIKNLNEGCIRIAYITGSNIRFSNQQELIRLENLEKRRGAKLQQRRKGKPFQKKYIESSAAFFFIGNEYNLKTYKEFHLPPVFFIKNTGYEFDIPFNFKKKRAMNFLFLASAGQVHKGLDLLLEVFSAPGFNANLYICSSFKDEKDFCELYDQELNRRNNIHPIGFLDIQSAAFKEIVEICSYIIMPSCSEGIAGSVLTGMSAGLIPIVSRECGFENDEVIHLESCEIEKLSEVVIMYSQKNLDWIYAQSEFVKKIVSTRYNKNEFSNSIRNAFIEIRI
ncbi:MAG: glycosyltransferase [Selenomonadaceae bacterium]